ncbi:MAG TPA: glycosyltransferase family 1 protein [Chryseosolibacter sp.]
MKKLGVLVLSRPENGGTFQYTLSMVEALTMMKGWSITLYTEADNSNYNSFGFPVKYVGASPSTWPLQTLAAYAGIKFREPFPQEELILAPIYSPVLLHTRKPFVYTLHDVQEYYFPENFSRAQKIWRKQIHLLLTKRATRIICESNFVRKDIERFLGVPSKKISVIVAPPLQQQETHYDRAQLDAIRRKYNIEGRYFFYPAQFWLHKNHARLVEAFAKIAERFDDVSLVLTGKKRDEFENVFSLVAKLQLQNRVIHTGYVDNEDLPGLYQNAYALVMPSLFESVSIPVYEAFLNRTAVCCSNVVALPEQVGDAGLLFDPRSVDSITDAMTRVMENPALRDRLVEAGTLQISKVTTASYAKELHEMLGKILE